MTTALRKLLAAAGVIGFAIVSIQAAVAENAGSLEIDVADCVALASPMERFACYENRARAALGIELVDPPTPEEHVEGHDAKEAADGTDAISGMPADQAASLEVIHDDSARQTEVSTTAGENSGFGQRASTPEEPAQLFATIASLRETVPNSYLITLENGQVWRQMRPQWYPLQAGQRVRIYSTRWGPAYRLASEELNGFIQVERVR